MQLIFIILQQMKIYCRKIIDPQFPLEELVL